MIERFTSEIWTVMLDLSPSLLLGLFIAGLLHEFVPTQLIQKKLSGANFASVLRSVLIGVPMPLCSCGVVPTAIGLKNEGASKGAVTAFLISTPQTGVDSVLVSASFLGWPFALFKVGAAFITGMLGGQLVNASGKDAPPLIPVLNVREEKQSGGRIANTLRYAIFDLLAMIDLWLIVGIIAAALISTLIPTDYLRELSWTAGIGGMLLMLAISMPLYICTTGSVPIAASLISAGMAPGTALVFLMAGPATNVATIGAVYRALGGRVLGIYLGSVAVMSIIFGLLFDWVLATPETISHHHHSQAAQWLNIVSAIVLSALLIFLLLRRLKNKFGATPKEENMADLVLKVGGMSCNHCTANVKKTLESFDNVEMAEADLSTGDVRIRGEELDPAVLAEAVRQAGYTVK